MRYDGSSGHDGKKILSRNGVLVRRSIKFTKLSSAITSTAMRRKISRDSDWNYSLDDFRIKVEVEEIHRRQEIHGLSVNKCWFVSYYKTHL